MNAPSPMVSTRTAWILGALAALLLLFAGSTRLRQGIDLEDQGLWILGTSMLQSGEAVHARLETADSPLRYWILRPFAAFAGRDFPAWVWLHSLLLGLVGGFGTAWLARRVGPAALIWPLALLAIERLPLPAALALAVSAWAWRPDGNFRRDAILGFGGAAIAAIDFGWGLASLLAIAVATFNEHAPRRRRFLALAAGALGAVALGHLAALLHGAGPAAWRNTWTLGPARLIEGWSENGGLGTSARWWNTLREGAWLHLPFAGLNTGESLGPVWPAQGMIRATALRAMAGLTLLLPFLLALRLGWKRRAGRAAITALFLALGLWMRAGDVPSLRESFVFVLPLTLLGLPLAFGVQVRRAALALLALACLPLAAETLWLVATHPREGVSTWPRAGVDVTETRQARWETLAETLAPLEGESVLVWPNSAGLHPLFELQPATRYVNLRHVEPDARALRDQLVTTQPRAVILSVDRNFGNLGRRPGLGPAWEYLQRNYRIGGTAAGGYDRFRLLQRLSDPTSEWAALPLRERLPEIELTVANESSPALRKGLSIGQSFTLGAQDLEGFAVRWSTRGENVPLEFRVRVWQWRGDDFDALLAFSTLDATVSRNGARSWFRYPVEETAGKTIAIALEAMETPTDEVRLSWHRHDVGSSDVDLFPGGTALLDLQPVDADLFFVVYTAANED